MKNSKFTAKPFLKWAGGKTQLLEELESRLPACIKQKRVINCYIEPFVGGGALFFYLKSRYQIKKAYIMDNNPDLILAYKVIKRMPAAVIKELQKIERCYLSKSAEKRTTFYYRIRTAFNNQKSKINHGSFSSIWIKHAAFLIFLNKTCFNGLFRQNNRGGFNVPHGNYRNPKIADFENITAVSRALSNTVIFCADFTKSKKYASKNALVYFDPPYRPLNATASFTSYTKDGFSEQDQLRLANLCKHLSDKGVYVLLSNSDPTNEDKKDSFFDDIYREFNIQRVLANRMVNCNGDRRGQIRELLIANY